MPNSNEPGTIILKDGRLGFNSDNFWKKTYAALIKAADGDFGSAFDTMLSSSDAETPEHKAYRLVFNALYRACVSILTDRNAPDQQRLLKNIERAGLANTAFYHNLSSNLGDGKYAIDNSFFKEPQTHDLLKAIQADYTAFLRDTLLVGENQATALAAVLPRRFVYELACEWDRADYGVVKAYFDNPILDILKKQAAHELRHADLLRLFAKPAFNDPRVTLTEMYIEPEFWVHGSCIPLKKDNLEGGSLFRRVEDKLGRHHFYQHKQHNLLHPFVLKWVRREDCLSLPGEKDSILIILGQPGQGKSSAFLRTIDQMLREHPGTVENIFLVRLRDIIHAARLVEDPLPEICKHLKLEDEADLKNCLLLLDGLDELYMSQGLTLMQIHEFVRKLRQQLKNSAALSLRVALTSRTNYLKLDDLGTEDYLILHLADLSLEQQQEWLCRYRKHYQQQCVLTEDDLQKIAKKENKAYDRIRELINQPILLQMIAASGMPIDEKTNSALIYKELFDKLIKRDWSPEDGQLEKFKKLTASDLRRFLQTLALHIFQKPSGHEYARRADFEQEGPLKDEIERLASKLGLQKLPLKELVKDLLVSFYFQEVQRDTEEKRRGDDHDSYAYEFLHKSLQEYLVAEKLWDSCRLKLLAEEEGYLRIRKTREVYDLIAPLFERKVLTQEVADYLHEIVSNDTETDKTALKERIKQLLPGLLRANFLMKHEEKDTEPPPMNKMLGNFFGFWSLASALIAPHEVAPRDEKAFQTALESNSYFPEEEMGLVAHFLILSQRSYFRTLRLFHQNLYGADLCGADFRGTNLCGTDLRMTDLRGADLRGADLRGADLRVTDFSGADLRGAILHGANLRGADLRRTNLSLANLSLANLSQANLSEADLSRANLSRANLSGARLYRANLHGAGLSGTYLSRADFRGANLRGANLHGANLHGANLRGANLHGADLHGADLYRTRLVGKELGKSNFEYANIEDVVGLEDAIGLEEANFNGTIYEGKFSKEK